MSIYPFNISAFNRDLSFLQGGTYGLFQLLQRDNVTGKLGAVLIAADILHSIYDFNRCKNRKENTFRGILGRRNLLDMLNKINLAS